MEGRVLTAEGVPAVGDPYLHAFGNRVIIFDSLTYDSAWELELAWKGKMFRT